MIEELKMIKVKNDWSWIKNHAQQSMMKDKQLQDDVLKIAIKFRIEVDNIIELYSEGLNNEIENGEYLSFKDWFYRFF